MNATATLISFDNRGNLMEADLFTFTNEETTVNHTPVTTENAKALVANHPNITYIAVTNGDVVSTRSSKTMVYTHAIEVAHADGSTGIYSWHKSEANASKALGSVTRYYDNATIVPVTAHPYSSTQAKEARKAEKARYDARYAAK